MSLITALFTALGLFVVYYVVILAKGIKVARADGIPVKPNTLAIATGAFTNFLDTLGIGSFATTTTIFRSTNEVRDEKMPGTLNVGHTVPTFVEAFTLTALFRTAIDATTLIEMIVAAILGAWIGARFFGRWPRRKIQIGMGFALLAVVGIMFYRTVYGDPTGGNVLKLTGPLLVAGLVGNFVLGVLMTIGIGLYAPCMLLVSMLGMSPAAAFPVMMGSCAFLMPVASRNFIQLKSYDLKAAMGLLIGGIPGVLLATYVVKSIPILYLKWLVMAVVVYTAISLLLTARRERTAAELAPAATH
jgi:uncharacterized membrane protein YfcA